MDWEEILSSGEGRVKEKRKVKFGGEREERREKREKREKRV